MKRHGLVFGAVALAGAALDLVTKTLAFRYVQATHRELTVVRGWFGIETAYNPGVVWSIGQGARTLWLVVSLLAIPLIVGIFVRSRKTWTATICLAMIEAGTIGNCWDRIFHPGVRDFIKFYFVRANGIPAVWPLFNLADSCIVVGVILLSIELYFFEEKKAKTPTPEPQPPTPVPSPAPRGPGDPSTP
ncbi:MAG TPA: signal peptidase II [Planctomycetota bacterium]|nr:signal peptidase II [Planctomycetota bacterium]